MTPAAFATICASACASTGTVATVVMSPAPTSSASASRTTRSSRSRESGKVMSTPTPQHRVIDQTSGADDGGERDQRRTVEHSQGRQLLGVHYRRVLDPHP